MANPIERKVWAGAATGILIFVAVAALALRSGREVAADEQWVSHTHQVLASLEAMESAIGDAESSMRGYALTSDAVFLRQHMERRHVMDDRLGRIGVLTTDNRLQQQRLEDLRRRIADKVAFMDELRASTERGGTAAALRTIATGRGLTTMRAVTAGIGAMRSEEDRLLAERTAAAAVTATRASSVLIVLGTLGTGLLILSFGLVARRVRDQQQAQQALEASEERLHLIVDKMIAGLVITNDRGKIESINPAAQRMFGYSADEIVGRYFKRLVVAPEADDQEVERFLLSVQEQGMGQVTEWDGRRSDGAVFPLELSLFEFRTATARHFAGIVRDISERREIDRMKDEFISVVSHELRTPLTSIRGALQLVLAERPAFQDPEHEPLLNIALNNCERLIRIINDILDVSKIEAGQIDLRRRPCQVRDIVRDSIESVQEMARASSVRVVADLPAGLPPVLADVDRIVQVFVNLLSNAVKFSPAQSVVTIAAVEQPGDRVAISIRDRGVGISAEDFDKLFLKFRQLDGSATRSRGGTGLGLAIVKALTEQHGGSVAVASTPGDGTTFTVTLPAAVNEGALDRRTPLTIPTAAPRRARTVLVVDDDADVRRVLRGLLQMAGYTVIEAADGDAAVRAASDHLPDLITMDLVMPVRGGLDAIAALSADPRTATIPIVVVSAMSETIAVEPLLSVLPKPVSADRLLREIDQLVGRAPAGNVLLAEDDGDLRNVLAQALTRKGFHVETAANGEAARVLFDAARWDLVLVDLHMPLLDGFGVIEHVRSTVAGRDTPIVVISGSNTGQGERRSLQLGANVYFAKPVNAESLVTELNRLLAAAPSSAMEI